MAQSDYTNNLTTINNGEKVGVNTVPSPYSAYKPYSVPQKKKTSFIKDVLRFPGRVNQAIYDTKVGGFLGDTGADMYNLPEWSNMRSDYSKMKALGVSAPTAMTTLVPQAFKSVVNTVTDLPLITGLAKMFTGDAKTNLQQQAESLKAKDKVEAQKAAQAQIEFDNQKSIDEFINNYTKLNATEQAALDLKGAQAKAAGKAADAAYNKGLAQTNLESSGSLTTANRSLVGELMDRRGLLTDEGGPVGPAQQYGLYDTPIAQNQANVSDILKASQSAKEQLVANKASSKVAMLNALAEIKSNKKQLEAQKVLEIANAVQRKKVKQ
jgi:hypothetical protein